jgi:hypothetical protein
LVDVYEREGKEARAGKVAEAIAFSMTAMKVMKTTRFQMS